MRLLLIRHAIAEDRDEFAATGQDDALRPLTREGRFKMRRNAAGLKRSVSQVDLLATSPLLRAVETAEILAKAWRTGEPEVADVLAGDGPHQAFYEWLVARAGHETVACVGHEPHLGGLASWLLSGSTRSFVALRKGGAALIEFGELVAPGSGTLLWAIPPAELRRMAE